MNNRMNDMSTGDYSNQLDSLDKLEQELLQQKTLQQANIEKQKRLLEEQKAQVMDQAITLKKQSEKSLSNSLVLYNYLPTRLSLFATMVASGTNYLMQAMLPIDEINKGLKSLADEMKKLDNKEKELDEELKKPDKELIELLDQKNQLLKKKFEQEKKLNSQAQSSSKEKFVNANKFFLPANDKIDTNHENTEYKQTSRKSF